mgnify:CR=1 FL=1
MNCFFLDGEKGFKDGMTFSDKSLVLMDEPELSFHLAWQIDFLRNMQTIVEERQIQSIIGTHSPQVFNNDWDLSVDLYTQSKSFS